MNLTYRNGIMWCKIQNERILKESIMLDGKALRSGTIINGFNVNSRQRGFDVYSNNMGGGWYIAFFYIDENCILQVNPYKRHGTDIYPIWEESKNLKMYIYDGSEQLSLL